MKRDYIKNKGRPKSNSRGPRRHRRRRRDLQIDSGEGPSRRLPDRAPSRWNPYASPQVTQGTNGEAGTKLYVSNLDYGVSSCDIVNQFSQAGQLKGHFIHRHCSGRSKGTAEVDFVHKSDALAALNNFNNKLFNGKKMKIQLVGNPFGGNVSVTHSATNSILGNPDSPPQVTREQETLTVDGTNIEAGTKLYVSNLDYGVSSTDIVDQLSQAGELKGHFLHRHRSGKSKGTAEVVFVRQSDALAAIKNFNNKLLNGKEMKIELVGIPFGGNVSVPFRPPTSSIHGNLFGESRQEARRFADDDGGDHSGYIMGEGSSRGGRRSDHRRRRHHRRSDHRHRHHHRRSDHRHRHHHHHHRVGRGREHVSGRGDNGRRKKKKKM